MSLLAHRPRLSGLAIWNMCVVFFGIQIGFGLPSTVATGERTELAFLISYIDRAVRRQKGKSLDEFIEELGAL